jgi:hypothetical protein
MKTALRLAAALAIATLAACSAPGEQREGAATGKRLIELRQSYEAGAMSREAYEAERRRIIEQ